MCYEGGGGGVREEKGGRQGGGKGQGERGKSDRGRISFSVPSEHRCKKKGKRSINSRQRTRQTRERRIFIRESGILKTTVGGFSGTWKTPVWITPWTCSEGTLSDSAWKTPIEYSDLKEVIDVIKRGVAKS
jgi:hypothetical protein